MQINWYVYWLHSHIKSLFGDLFTSLYKSHPILVYNQRWRIHHLLISLQSKPLVKALFKIWIISMYYSSSFLLWSLSVIPLPSSDLIFLLMKAINSFKLDFLETLICKTRRIWDKYRNRWQSEKRKWSWLAVLTGFDLSRAG